MRTKPEKRDCARFCCESPVVIEECGTGFHFEAWMYNYSLQGLYFESDLLLLSGNRLNVWFSNLSESSLPDVNFAEVRWCEEIIGSVVMNNYGAGIRYHQPITCREFPRHFKAIQGGVKDVGNHEK